MEAASMEAGNGGNLPVRLLVVGERLLEQEQHAERERDASRNLGMRFG